MINKRGDVAISTIVIIILALVVLVIVIYGFTVGWGNLFQNILVFGGGKINVESVVRGCQVACTTQASFDYCLKQRDVVFDEKQKAEKLTCKTLELKNVGLDFCNTLDCEVSAKKGLCNGDLNSNVCERNKDFGRSNCESFSVCKWIDDNNPNDNMGNCALKQGSNCAAFNEDQATCIKLGCEWSSL